MKTNLFVLNHQTMNIQSNSLFLLKELNFKKTDIFKK